MRLINTARGVYRLQLPAIPECSGDTYAFTITLERADGIEKVALRCIVPANQLTTDELAAPELIELRLEAWLVAGFEQIRESALRTIRSERRLWEVRFRDQAGPLQPI
ncbi:MAG: hypothetical protein IVW54_15430 [Candidatus Binataceae bacterium]|nr:hypothetical protein [Candidatus Binataceae bacterium]